MDFLEDLGGCAIIAIAGIIVLVLLLCVAVVVVGGAIPELIG